MYATAPAILWNKSRERERWGRDRQMSVKPEKSQPCWILFHNEDNDDTSTRVYNTYTAEMTDPT